MERMLRKKKDNSDYEIDRELTGKFAIEKNAEYQDRIAELEEENKKLKSDLSECECSMHFENDEVGYRKRECKKLKEENKKLSNDAMEDMKYMAKLELKIKMLMEELEEVYRQNVRIKKDLAMYQKLRDQLFGGLEEEDLYEDIK